MPTLASLFAKRSTNLARKTKIYNAEDVTVAITDLISRKANPLVFWNFFLKVLPFLLWYHKQTASVMPRKKNHWNLLGRKLKFLVSKACCENNVLCMFFTFDINNSNNFCCKKKQFGRF